MRSEKDDEVTLPPRPILYSDEANLGDVNVSLMIHRSGVRSLSFIRNTGVDGDRYVSFGLHLTAADIVALHELLGDVIAQEMS